MSSNERWIVRVIGALAEPRTRHLDGSGLMAWPAFLLVEHIDGQAFIYRYAKDGVFGGDTWHETLDAARDQISYEYPGLTGSWTEIPSDVSDFVKFGQALVKN